MKILLLCILSTISINCYATFEQVWVAYKKSKTKEIRDLNSESVDEKYNFDNQFNELKLELSAGYQDDALKNLNSFVPRETIVNSYSAKLIKPTLKYGTFSVEHKHIDYDLSNWQPQLKSNLDGDFQYDIRTIVAYTYDFLKEDMQIQSDLIKAQYDEQSTALKLEQEKEYLDVFTRFVQAKLNLFQIRLSRENAQKDLKRLKTIQSRVRTGSSRKVDLYLAQSAYHTQTESIEIAKKNLEENIALLEFILGVKIDDSLLKYVSWDTVPVSYTKAARKNTTLELLERRLELSKKSLLQAKNSSRVSLNLALQYETNGVQNNRSEAYNDNFEGNHNRSASLVLNIPLGIDRTSALNRRLVLDSKLNQMQLVNKQGEIETNIKAIKKQIYYTKNAFKDSKQRTNSFKNALSETKKLYSRGQSNFDELIRREESYISAKLQEKSNLAGLELLIANLAFLEGNIESYLDSYRD